MKSALERFAQFELCTISCQNEICRWHPTKTYSLLTIEKWNIYCVTVALLINTFGLIYKRETYSILLDNIAFTCLNIELLNANDFKSVILYV